MLSELAGRRALVTGAASGIGRAIAVALGKSGARVVGIDLVDSDRSECPIILADIADEAAAGEAVDRAAATLGGLYAAWVHRDDIKKLIMHNDVFSSKHPKKVKA